MFVGTYWSLCFISVSLGLSHGNAVLCFVGEGELIDVSCFLGSFSRFDFRNHGNKRYGSPFDSTHDQRSSQGKMEKSFLRYDYLQHK